MIIKICCWLNRDSFYLRLQWIFFSFLIDISEEQYSIHYRTRDRCVLDEGRWRQQKAIICLIRNEYGLTRNYRINEYRERKKDEGNLLINEREVPRWKNTVRLVDAEIRTVLNEVSVRNMSVINQNSVRNRKYTENRRKRYEMYEWRCVFLRPLNGPKLNAITIDLGVFVSIYLFDLLVNSLNQEWILTKYSKSKKQRPTIEWKSVSLRFTHCLKKKNWFYRQEKTTVQYSKKIRCVWYCLHCRHYTWKNMFGSLSLYLYQCWSYFNWRVA